jgi:hypothetical protein
MSANLIQNDGVEIPAKTRRLVVGSNHIASAACRDCDQDFIVAILHDETRAPNGGLWIPSFGSEILSASHNLITKTSDGARMTAAT